MPYPVNEADLQIIHLGDLIPILNRTVGRRNEMTATPQPKERLNVAPISKLILVLSRGAQHLKKIRATWATIDISKEVIGMLHLFRRELRI